MKLKRYVQVENGMVYDMHQIGYVSVCFTNKGGSYNGVYTIGDDYKEGFPIIGWNSPITATADDVWKLIPRNPEEEWLAFTIWGNFFCFIDEEGLFLVTEGNVDKTDVKALYCPITENGTVVRYELVWERRKNERQSDEALNKLKTRADLYSHMSALERITNEELSENINNESEIRLALTELAEIKKRAEEVRTRYAERQFGIGYANVAKDIDYILKGERS